jgi:glycerol-3-phosphate acyltransferase PlsY
MTTILPAALTLLAAYLLGSLSFAVLVSKAFGLADPRTYGSKNPGATNVLRSGHKGAAVLTLAGDAFKGWLAVVMVQRLSPALGLADWVAPAAAVAVFLGHLWPVFFRFQGGKGVATAAGAILALNPWLALACALTWAIIAFFFRYASLASMLAAIFAAFYSAYGWGINATFVALLVIAGLVVLRHQGNIRALLGGTERRIGEKAAPKS